jgi:hypothetical protein
VTSDALPSLTVRSTPTCRVPVLLLALAVLLGTDSGSSPSGWWRSSSTMPCSSCTQPFHSICMVAVRRPVPVPLHSLPAPPVRRGPVVRQHVPRALLPFCWRLGFPSGPATADNHSFSATPPTYSSPTDAMQVSYSGSKCYVIIYSNGCKHRYRPRN